MAELKSSMMKTLLSSNDKFYLRGKRARNRTSFVQHRASKNVMPKMFLASLLELKFLRFILYSLDTL